MCWCMYFGRHFVHIRSVCQDKGYFSRADGAKLPLAAKHSSFSLRCARLHSFIKIAGLWDVCWESLGAVAWLASEGLPYAH